MTTSGVTINQLSRDDIINAALRKLVVIGEGQTANTLQITSAAQALNNLVAEYRTLGMSIWARKGLDVPMVAGQLTYVFGVGQAINVAYPLHIYTAMLTTGPTFDNKIQMQALSFTDFQLLPNNSTGSPVNFTYKPMINMGEMRVWPTPDATVQSVGTKIHLEYQTPFEYFISGTDNPMFPEEWNNALIYGLAALVSDEYGISTQKQQWISSQAATHLATALSGGAEDASMFLQPERGRW